MVQWFVASLLLTPLPFYTWDWKVEVGSDHVLHFLHSLGSLESAYPMLCTPTPFGYGQWRLTFPQGTVVCRINATNDSVSPKTDGLEPGPGFGFFLG